MLQNRRTNWASTAGTLLTCAGAALGQCTPAWTNLPADAQPNDEVLCLKMWDRGAKASPVLLAGGNFSHAGSTTLNYAGIWNGASWAAMGTGFNGSALCVTVFDPDSNGPAHEQPTYGGVFFTAGDAAIRNVARWDRVNWNGFGAGMDGSFGEVFALEPYGTELFATGSFTSASGTPADGAARWDGTQWHAFADPGARFGYALHTYNGEVYVGGPGGVLRWTGSQWAPPGSNPPTDDVYAMTTWQDKLVAAGWFNSGCCGSPPPPQPGERIAVFDGVSWSPLGSGMNGYVGAVAAFDPDGPGPSPELLIAGGVFTTAGGQPTSRIAAWNGSQWMPLGSGVGGEVEALAVFQDHLYVGGFFLTAGGLNSPYLAIWGCTHACDANCDGSSGAPILNANDFMCFINAFAAASPTANCDHSTAAPILNVNDFQCYLNVFAAGCP